MGYRFPPKSYEEHFPISRQGFEDWYSGRTPRTSSHAQNSLPRNRPASLPSVTHGHSAPRGRPRKGEATLPAPSPSSLRPQSLTESISTPSAAVPSQLQAQTSHIDDTRTPYVGKEKGNGKVQLANDANGEQPGHDLDPDHQPISALGLAASEREVQTSQMNEEQAEASGSGTTFLDDDEAVNTLLDDILQSNAPEVPGSENKDSLLQLARQQLATAAWIERSRASREYSSPYSTHSSPETPTTREAAPADAEKSSKHEDNDLAHEILPISAQETVQSPSRKRKTTGPDMPDSDRDLKRRTEIREDIYSVPVQEYGHNYDSEQTSGRVVKDDDSRGISSAGQTLSRPHIGMAILPETRWNKELRKGDVFRNDVGKCDSGKETTTDTAKFMLRSPVAEDLCSEEETHHGLESPDPRFLGCDPENTIIVQLRSPPESSPEPSPESSHEPPPARRQAKKDTRPKPQPIPKPRPIRH